MEIIEKLAKQLEVFTPETSQKLISVTFPIVLDMNKNCLALDITSDNCGYMVLRSSDVLERLNDTAEEYLVLFAAEYPQVCEGFCADGEKIHKSFDKDCSITCALDQVIKFFLKLDKFVSSKHLK